MASFAALPGWPCAGAGLQVWELEIYLGLNSALPFFSCVMLHRFPRLPEFSVSSLAVRSQKYLACQGIYKAVNVMLWNIALCTEQVREGCLYVPGVVCGHECALCV